MKLALRMAAFLIACGNRGFIPPTWPIVLNLSVQLSQMLSHTLIHLFLITILWSKQGNYYCLPVRDLSFHSNVYALLVSPSLFHTNLPSFFPSFSFFPSLPVPRLSCFLSFFLFKICFCTKLWVNRVSLQFLLHFFKNNTPLVGTQFILVACKFSNHEWLGNEELWTTGTFTHI